jgi:hypothetical protein
LASELDIEAVPIHLRERQQIGLSTLFEGSDGIGVPARRHERLAQAVPRDDQRGIETYGLDKFCDRLGGIGGAQRVDTGKLAGQFFTTRSATHGRLPPHECGVTPLTAFAVFCIGEWLTFGAPETWLTGGCGVTVR